MKVTVLVITYNHAPFIAQALNSVLMQETSFPFEVIVSEDCSTDATREIIADFKARYPAQIRLLLSECNLNTNYVLTRGIEAARGEYIALLDGDDYWTSPAKLQKQADFLDRCPDCAICFHNALSFYEDRDLEPFYYVDSSQKALSSMEDLLVADFIPTAAVMFRRGLFTCLPDWYDGMDIGDWPLHLINAQYGKIGYIDEVLSAYRIHDNGVWTSRTKIQRHHSILTMYEVLWGCLESRYHEVMDPLMNRRYYRLAEEYEKLGDLATARVYARKCSAHQMRYRRIPESTVLEMLLRLYYPKVHRCVGVAKSLLAGMKEKRPYQQRSEPRRTNG